MRIRDWSSDLCSSDLVAVALFGFEEGGIKGSGRGAVGRYFRRLLPVSVRIGVEVVARLDAGVHRRLVDTTLGAKSIGRRRTIRAARTGDGSGQRRSGRKKDDESGFFRTEERSVGKEGVVQFR